jgi:phosphoglycolate phosphatase
MIGDRSYDIDAAHANRLRCLAAGWGYGTPQECAQADAVAPTPADVADIVSPQGLAAVR